MEKRSTIVILLLSAILVGIILILLNIYSKSCDKDGLEERILQKIMELDITVQQKQEIINVIKKEAKVSVNSSTCDSNEDCAPGSMCFVKCLGNVMINGNPVSPGICTPMDKIECLPSYPPN